MIYTIYLTIISAFLFISLSLFRSENLRLSLSRYRVSLPKQKRLLKIFSPFSKIGDFLVKYLRISNLLRKKLENAKLKITPGEFFGFKIITMFLLLWLSYILFGKLDPLKIIISFVLGYLIPDFFVSQRIRQRRYAIVRLLPETIDLLGLCVEAGLDFATAVKWVIEKSRPHPLLEEFAVVLEEIRWGKSRSDALRDMARRLNIPELRSFVQTLVQADRLGTPISEAFTILSEDTRLKRFQRGERIALKAPIKILIPLIFCILPVIGIIVGGPIFLQFMRGGLFTIGR